jgi:hypothetical protein
MSFVRRLCYLGLFAVMIVPIFTSAAQDAQETGEIAGFWHTKGYAWLFDISPANVRAYQVTEATCVLVFESEDLTYEPQSVVVHDAQFPGIASLLADPSDVLLELEANPDLLRFDNDGVTPIFAERVDGLPAACSETAPDGDSPEVNFEHFWSMFAENYAFFDLYDIDWDSVYETYRPQVNAETTNTELFEMFQSMLAGIPDAHINLIASIFQNYSPGQYAEWTLEEDGDIVVEYAALVVENYLIDEPQIVANEQIIYGHLSDTIGYINLLSMQEFSTDGDDLAALESAMEAIVADLADVETIVVDVRFNPGGTDQNAVFIAGYFAPESTLAFSKAVWDGQAFVELGDVLIEPAEDEHFTQDVYLLTSNYTTSAGEVFTMTMNALPQVTTVGETTQGAFSDILPVFLPNGWLVTLSNERYTAYDGQVYEGPGLQPTVEVAMSPEALAAGDDPVIERVLELIGAP